MISVHFVLGCNIMRANNLPAFLKNKKRLSATSWHKYNFLYGKSRLYERWSSWELHCQNGAKATN